MACREGSRLGADHGVSVFVRKTPRTREEVSEADGYGQVSAQRAKNAMTSSVFRTPSCT